MCCSIQLQMVKFINPLTISLIIVTGLALHKIKKSLVLNIPFSLRIIGMYVIAATGFPPDSISKIIKSIKRGLILSKYFVRFQCHHSDFGIYRGFSSI